MDETEVKNEEKTEGVIEKNVENVELEELRSQLKAIKDEKDKEIQSLKSQLGHSNKRLEDYEKNGKTAEQLAQMEKEKLEKQLEDLKNELTIKNLSAKKGELLDEYKINPLFSKLIEIDAKMSEEDLILKVKTISEIEKSYKTELLKQYSITEGAFKPKTKETTDFIEKLIGKNKTESVDLTKIGG